MQEHADDLARRRTHSSGMGGEEGVARQHAATRETRPTLIRALEMAKTKRVDRPWRKRGVMPV
jgi:acetyl-CoA carboxylase carboxyltransferase component